MDRTYFHSTLRPTRRKVVSILCMFVGALADTAILRSWGFTPPLALAALLAAGVSVGAPMKLRASELTAIRTG